MTNSQHGNEDLRNYIAVESNAFPSDLWGELCKWGPNLLKKQPIPKYDQHTSNYQTRGLLSGVLEECMRYATQDSDSSNEAELCRFWKIRAQQVHSAINIIEGWFMNPRHEFEAAAYPRRGFKHHSSQKTIKFRNYDESIELSDAAGFDILDRPTLQVLVHIQLDGPGMENSFKTGMTLHRLPSHTPISTILRMIGATDPKVDFLEFMTHLKGARHDGGGVSAASPDQIYRVGWKASPWADGTRVTLADIRRTRAPKNSSATWDLECTYRRRWVDIVDSTQDDWLSSGTSTHEFSSAGSMSVVLSQASQDGRLSEDNDGVTCDEGIEDVPDIRISANRPSRPASIRTDSYSSFEEEEEEEAILADRGVAVMVNLAHPVSTANIKEISIQKLRNTKQASPGADIRDDARNNHLCFQAESFDEKQVGEFLEMTSKAEQAFRTLGNSFADFIAKQLPRFKDARPSSPRPQAAHLISGSEEFDFDNDIFEDARENQNTFSAVLAGPTLARFDDRETESKEHPTLGSCSLFSSDFKIDMRRKDPEIIRALLVDMRRDYSSLIVRGYHQRPPPGFEVYEREYARTVALKELIDVKEKQLEQLTRQAMVGKRNQILPSLEVIPFVSGIRPLEKLSEPFRPAIQESVSGRTMSPMVTDWGMEKELNSDRNSSSKRPMSFMGLGVAIRSAMDLNSRKSDDLAKEDSRGVEPRLSLRAEVAGPLKIDAHGGETGFGLRAGKPLAHWHYRLQQNVWSLPMNNRPRLVGS